MNGSPQTVKSGPQDSATVGLLQGASMVLPMCARGPCRGKICCLVCSLFMLVLVVVEFAVLFVLLVWNFLELKKSMGLVWGLLNRPELSH